MRIHIDKERFKQLFYIQRLSYKEIADILNCSVAGLVNIRQRNKLPPRGWAYGHPMKGKHPNAWNKGIKGNKSHFWKGGKTKSSGGYTLIYKPSHHSCKKNKYVAEHRLVMEKFLKRPLTKIEHIHHKNGIKSDNRIENLELLTISQHAKKHFPKGFHFGINHNYILTVVPCSD